MPKKKKTEEIKKIEFPEQYMVIAADLSLRRPGWCVLKMYNGKPYVANLFSLDNKGKKNKTHGQILSEIYEIFYNNVISNLNIMPSCFFVREKSIMHMMTPAERDVTKVVGLMDFMLLDREWDEIYPVTVKKLVAGSGKAEKEEVAAALEKYVGKISYKCDDESDATAVAIAWLILHGQLEEKQ